MHGVIGRAGEIDLRGGFQEKLRTLPQNWLEGGKYGHCSSSH